MSLTPISCHPHLQSEAPRGQQEERSTVGLPDKKGVRGVSMGQHPSQHPRRGQDAGATQAQEGSCQQ